MKVCIVYLLQSHILESLYMNLKGCNSNFPFILKFKKVLKSDSVSSYFKTFEKCCNILKAEYSITRSHNIRERRIIPSRIQQKRYYYYISCIRNNKFMQHSTWYIMLVVKMMILVLNSNLTSPTNTMKKMSRRWWEEEKTGK